MSNATIEFQNAVADYIFTDSTTAGATTLASILSGIPSIFMSLHTSSPGEGGSQTTNEVAYTGYSRTSQPRTAAPVTGASPGWYLDLLTSLTKNAQQANFGACSGGSATAKYVGFGTAASGAGKLIAYAPICALTDNWFTLITNQRPTAGTATGWVLAQLNHLGADPVLAQDDELAIMATYNDSLHTNLSAGTAYFISNGTAIEGAWDTGLGFKLAITSGAGANPLTAAKCHSMQAIRVAGISISSGITPYVPALGAVILVT